MDEALGLDAAVLCDVLHLRQAQLTRQHHPGKAQFLQFQCALQGVDAHLGGAVPGQLRGNFADQGGHCQILTDDRIRTAGCYRPDSLFQCRQLGAIHGRIQCNVHRHAPGMAEAHGFLQTVCVKVAGTRAGVETRKAQIYRVCAAEHRRAEHFFTAHRG